MVVLQMFEHPCELDLKAVDFGLPFGKQAQMATVMSEGSPGCEVEMGGSSFLASIFASVDLTLTAHC